MAVSGFSWISFISYAVRAPLQCRTFSHHSHAWDLSLNPSKSCVSPDLSWHILPDPGQCIPWNSSLMAALSCLCFSHALCCAISELRPSVFSFKLSSMSNHCSQMFHTFSVINPNYLSVLRVFIFCAIMAKQKNRLVIVNGSSFNLTEIFLSISDGVTVDCSWNFRLFPLFLANSRDFVQITASSPPYRGQFQIV